MTVHEWTWARVRLHYIEDLMLPYGAERRAIVSAPHVMVCEPMIQVPKGADGQTIAEYCFTYFNRGSGKEHADLDGKHLRSLSMGDVVEIVTPFNGFWLCEMVGFAQIKGVQA